MDLEAKKSKHPMRVSDKQVGGACEITSLSRGRSTKRAYAFSSGKSCSYCRASLELVPTVPMTKAETAAASGARDGDRPWAPALRSSSAASRTADARARKNGDVDVTGPSVPEARAIFVARTVRPLRCNVASDVTLKVSCCEREARGLPRVRRRQPSRRSSGGRHLPAVLFEAEPVKVEQRSPCDDSGRAAAKARYDRHRA